MRIELPEFGLVVLIGTSGSGKSTFARSRFLPTQILSSDAFRGLVCDSEDSQDATKDAFEALHFILSKRLELGRLTVVDATNVQRESRAPLLGLANRWHALKTAIVLDVPESVCHERNALRPNRQFGPHVVRNQRASLRKSLPGLAREGFHRVFILKPEDLDGLEIAYSRIWSRKLEETGPFDIVGDIHGCFEELVELLEKLGWVQDPEWRHPEGRRLIFLGDLVDRGPQPVKVLRLVMDLVRRGAAFCVPGNHDDKLVRALRGRKVKTAHGLAETLDRLEKEAPEFRADVAEFLDGLVSHLVLDGGALTVAHAGMRQEMQGRASGAVREFALYGETTGEIDDFGLPVRHDWARDYRGRAMVVYGHTPTPEPVWVNGTINIDTGCCFGGRLTALRYPEKALVQVQAKHVYAEPSRPISSSSARADDGLLDIEDVLGRRSVETRSLGRVTIREENALAALEVMSRFAVDPRWLVYLPPTMSPCDASAKEGWLERPEEVFAYFRENGIEEVMCQEKHMGSRAVAVLCRSEAAAVKRFQIAGEGQGVITTRTGRRFFDDPSLEREALARMAEAAGSLFDELASDWLLLDMEIMPWSAKGAGLLKEQYAPVGAAAEAAAAAWMSAASGAASHSAEGSAALLELAGGKAEAARQFREAYRRYCWPVTGLQGLVMAPFHLLASEGRVHSDKPHAWHMDRLSVLASADPSLFRQTSCLVVTLGDEAKEAAAARWWEELVESGGEGMVVKPLDFLPANRVQPAMKCRGPEYLRIIYGPEYRDEANLARLKRRSTAHKRRLALREFALGLEAMERFVEHQPLRMIHECVFGVLALESEPIDPRL